MPEQQTADTSVAEQIKDRSQQSGITVVTADNFDEYVDEKLGPRVPDVSERTDEPEGEGAAEQEKEAKPNGTDIKAQDKGEPEKPGKKGKKEALNERFSELTAARKAAEERAEKAAAEAKALREARDKAEEEARALKAKYEPPKSDDIGPEPQPGQFTDINEYSKALKDWTADNTRREDARKAAEEEAKRYVETVKTQWAERQKAAIAEIADYSQVLEASTVKISDQARDAIVESEVGPQILYHLAKNPDVAEKLGKMTVGRMLKELGKIELSLSGGAAKPETPKSEAKTTVAEISRAPAPITPLRGASAPVTTLRGTDEVPNSLSYEDWKKLRKAGKIR